VIVPTYLLEGVQPVNDRIQYPTAGRFYALSLQGGVVIHMHCEGYHITSLPVLGSGLRGNNTDFIFVQMVWSRDV
jgi:hypothetical protein